MILNNEEFNYILSVQNENSKIKAENAALRMKNAELETKLNAISSELETLKNNWIYKLFKKG